MRKVKKTITAQTQVTVIRSTKTEYKSSFVGASLWVEGTRTCWSSFVLQRLMMCLEAKAMNSIEDTLTAWHFHSCFSFRNRWKFTESHVWFLHCATKMMNCTQILYKVCCQGSHFVFGFFRIGPSSSASSPSTSPGTTAPRVPHGGMFELHQILEDGIAENTARMLRLTSGKRSTSLVEVYCDESGVAGVTALLSDLHGDTATLESAQRIKPPQNMGY